MLGLDMPSATRPPKCDLPYYVGIIHLSILLPGFFILRQIRADVFDRDPIWRDRHTEMAGAAEHIAAQVAILGGAVRAVGAGGAGLGDFLVDDSIEFLFDEQMVVAVKDGGNVVLDE